MARRLPNGQHAACNSRLDSARPWRSGVSFGPVVESATALAGDFAAACRSVAESPDAAVIIVTGFYIPTAKPPCGETDGPLGAIFLARAFTQLGIRAAPVTDDFCVAALNAGLQACGLEMSVRVLPLPDADTSWPEFLSEFWLPFVRESFLRDTFDRD